MTPMNDPFRGSHGHRSGLSANGGASQNLTGPTTPQRRFLFSNQTPTRDPFAPIPSPHSLRILLLDSERLRMSIQQDLASTQETLASTGLDLAAAQEAIKQRDDQIKLQNTQIEAKDKEIKAQEGAIKSRDDEIRSLQSEIHRLNVHIEKQDVTIKTQSRTIQDPRSLRQRRMEETSASLPATAQAWSPQNVQSFVGPSQSLSFGGPYQFAPGNGENTHYHPPHGYPTGPGGQMPYQMPYPVEPTTPSMRPQFELNGTNAGAHLQGLYNPPAPMGGPVPMHMTFQPTVHQTTFTAPGATSNTYGTNAYSGIEFEGKASDFGGRFRALWANIDKFGKTYVVARDFYPDVISASLKEYLMLDSNAAIAVKFLKHATTKPMCVAKVINYYLCKKMLECTEIVKNIDPSIDGEILSAKGRISLEAPNSVRYHLIAKIADQIALARQKPNFLQFCAMSRDNHVAALLALLEPLVASADDNHSVKESLKSIVMEAQQIGIDLFSCPYDIRFHFPGLNELYDPAVMMNLNPALNTNVLRTKVVISVTPYIRLGMINFEPARTRIVCGAKVYPGIPGEETAANQTPEHTK